MAKAKEIKKVIVDGDWGGDEMQLLAVLLAQPDYIEVLGTTCVFGNTSHRQVFENARNIIHFLKADHIKAYPGCAKPSDSDTLEGDGAHGSDGIGNVALEKSPLPYETKHAVDYILEQLRSNPPGTISITASGPLTNIAEAIRRDPETMKLAKEIVVMGGCTAVMEAKDVPFRTGNITYHADFNFQQAALDANLVMQSGLPIVLLPMNCTHELTVTPERQALISNVLKFFPDVAKSILGMMTAPAHLDMAKFGISPVMHDIHCAFWLLFGSKAYEIERGNVIVMQKDDIPWPETKMGHTVFTLDSTSNVTVASHLKDPDQLFAEFLMSIYSIFVEPFALPANEAVIPASSTGEADARNDEGASAPPDLGVAGNSVGGSIPETDTPA